MAILQTLTIILAQGGVRLRTLYFSQHIQIYTLLCNILCIIIVLIGAALKNIAVLVFITFIVFVHCNFG